MSFSGGSAEADTETGGSKRAIKEKEGWDVFKYEIVRLTHTLKLKGWRHVPLDRATDIEVKRLSGALTNAVYVVLPPKVLADTPLGTKLPVPKKLPP